MKRKDFTLLVIDLLNYMIEQGDNPIIDYVKRSYEEQNRLFKRKLSKCNGTYNMSKHQVGKAIDIYLVSNDGNYLFNWGDMESKSKKYHKYWVKLGGKPMIDWDKCHYEV